MNRITTPVDNMVEILKERGKMSVKELSKMLGVDQLVVERWLAILELNGIVRFDYRGLNEFIEYTEKKNKKAGGSEPAEETEIDLEEMKRRFMARIQKEGLSLEEARLLWRKYIESISETLKSSFYKKAREKGISDQEIESYWLNYRQEVMNL